MDFREEGWEGLAQSREGAKGVNNFLRSADDC
jgi:hypothetical protein